MPIGSRAAGYRSAASRQPGPSSQPGRSQSVPRAANDNYRPAANDNSQAGRWRDLANAAGDMLASLPKRNSYGLFLELMKSYVRFAELLTNIHAWLEAPVPRTTRGYNRTVNCPGRITHYDGGRNFVNCGFATQANSGWFGNPPDGGVGNPVDFIALEHTGPATGTTQGMNWREKWVRILGFPNRQARPYVIAHPRPHRRPLPRWAPSRNPYIYPPADPEAPTTPLPLPANAPAPRALPSPGAQEHQRSYGLPAPRPVARPIPRRPRQGEKEKKRKINAAAAVAWKMIGAATEFRDFTLDLYAALPQQYQKGGKNPMTVDAWDSVYTHWDKISVPDAMLNMLESSLEDAFYGVLGSGARHWAREMGRPIGLEAGGSLDGPKAGEEIQEGPFKVEFNAPPGSGHRGQITFFQFEVAWD